ncbi:MAG: hypothetical protein ACREUZ_08520 [Burkholderiales bacterium]
MYFWKIEHLKQDLAAGDFGDQKAAPYILASVALGAFAMATAGYFPYEDINLWTYSESVLFVLAPIIGTVAAYRANGGNAGIDFANRYFSLGFVLLIRLLMLLIPILLVVSLYMLAMYDLAEPVPTTLLEVALLGLWIVAYYWRLAKHIRDVTEAHSPASSNGSPASRHS